MAFPVPVDARAAKDFELVLGQEEMLRNSFDLNAGITATVEGEWMKLTTTGAVVAAKTVNAVDTSAAPAIGAKCCWTKYSSTSMDLGQSDAFATGKVDLLSGVFQAKSKLYDVGGTYAPGNLLVVVHDNVNGRGVLYGLDPAAITTRQLAGVVGRVIDLVNGVLHFESVA